MADERRLAELERAFAAHVHLAATKITGQPPNRQDLDTLQSWLATFHRRNAITPPTQTASVRDEV